MFLAQAFAGWSPALGRGPPCLVVAVTLAVDDLLHDAPLLLA